jgi:SRSO17 transposase
VTGVLREQPNKNCDTVAAVVPERSEQQVPYLLTDRGWEEQARNRQRIVQRLTGPRAGDGGLIFAETGCEKKGRHAGGVARQETGTVGKLTTGQGTGKCQYGDRPRAWLVATRWYLPEGGAVAEGRRTRAHVPQEGPCQTKAAIALALRDEATRCGVKQAGVSGDAD